MPSTAPRHPQHLQSLDWLFGQLPGRLTGYTIPADICHVPGRAVAPAGLAGPARGLPLAEGAFLAGVLVI